MAKTVNKDLPELEQRVLNFIRQNNLIPDKKPLLVAVSGGPDSVCLLHLLGQLRNELRLNLHVAHLDHQLRGEESEADARYVIELARRLDIPATVEARDVLSYRNKYRLSLEEAAREVRYTFFSELAKTIGADRVAVGHTQDDHIETILMHLIRGSGTGGLRGLQPVNQWQLGSSRITVIRPLLTVSRVETAAYCERYKLAPHIDSTNLSMSPLRNKIRLQLLPLLKEYNPAIAEALQRTANIAEDETALIERLGDIAWERIVKIKNNTVSIDKESFTGVHPAVQRYLIRKAIEQLVGNLKDIEAHHIEDILSALHKPAGKTIQLPYSLVFVVEYDRYLLGTDPATLSPFPPFKGEFTLNVPGKTKVNGWMVKTDVIEVKSGASPLDEAIQGVSLKNSSYFPLPLRERIKVRGLGKSEKPQTNRFTAYFDFDKTGDKLTVRPYRTGDRFQPLGMSESKKLGEFMIDDRVPHAWRNRIPIVCSPAQIMWVVGYRIDERVKVTEKMKRVVRVVFQRVGSTHK